MVDDYIEDITYKVIISYFPFVILTFLVTGNLSHIS